mgnify:FL=1
MVFLHPPFVGLQAAAKLAELGVGADGVEDGSVGKVVESCSTQTDPEPSFEHAMDILKKENIELFEKGRALQATYGVNQLLWRSVSVVGSLLKQIVIFMLSQVSYVVEKVDGGPCQRFQCRPRSGMAPAKNSGLASRACSRGGKERKARLPEA